MRRASLLLLVLGVSATAAAGQTPQGPNQDGESIYKTRCASCHDTGVPFDLGLAPARRAAVFPD